MLFPHQGAPARHIAGAHGAHLQVPHRDTRFSHSGRYRTNGTALFSPANRSSYSRPNRRELNCPDTREGVLVSLGSGLKMRATMSTAWSKVWIALALLVVTAAQGETLYERDGITLEGTVRMVARDAATCQVREDDAHHAGNDGKPLHVWRLDYGAFNRSGNPLRQLTAHFQIEAEWPPCTNWSGLGQYPGPVQWAGSFETLQRTGGLEAGGEARETLYVLAIDGQQPRFSRWQLDFRFGETAASSGPAPANPPAPERPPGPPRPVCDDTFDQWDDPPCWLELADRPDCYVWNTNYTPHKPVSWSGGCVEGRASGRGTATGTPVWFWEHDYSCSSAEAALGYCPPYESRGTYVDGKREGRWTEREAKNSVVEGPYVEGKRHGEWIEHRDGKVRRHRYSHGKYQE